MDRNTVIATILIALIMVVWLVWLTPPVPEAQGPADVDSTQVAEPEPEPIEPEPVPGLTEAAPEVTDTTLVGVRQGTERRIVVESDLYEAVFSTKGATPVSFRLKKYESYDHDHPVQLIDSTSQGALALVFTTPNNHVVDSRAFYFDADVQSDTLRLRGQPATLTFETEIGEGTLRQTYTFTPGEYNVDLDVVAANSDAFMTREGYDLVWNGGIPFTEGDADEEAQRAGAFARTGGDVIEVTLNSDPYGEQSARGRVDWAAVKSKYFTAVMIPGTETRGTELIGEQLQTEQGIWEDYTASLLMPPLDEPASYSLYLGPMEFYRITDYDVGLYDMVDYGWDFFEFMTRPLAKFVFIPAFTYLGQVLPNFGFVIIVIAILIKLAVYPLTKSSYKSMARMRELQPKMEAIKEKYGDNPQKQQEAMMKMYRETGVNPLGGCLPMLLQYPIIIALWQFLPQAIEIRQKGFLWAEDLSAPDVILQLPFTIPLYGDFVAGFTLLMGISMIFQMRLQMNPSTNPQAKIFTYVFPVMIFAIFNRLAAGLSLYYLIYNVFTAAQQKWINHQLEKEGVTAKDEKKGAVSKNGKGSKRKKSKK